MAADAVYDVVVVGAGMIGSAAAKYVTLHHTKPTVCLVGPPEPQAKTDATIHGAYYDETRIARKSDKDPTWGLLSQRSISRYRDIEKHSGLPIYTEVGYLAAGTKDGEYLNKMRSFVESINLEHRFLQTSDTLKSEFPYMNFSPDIQAIYTDKDSGYINPRQLVEAQKKIAISHGCEVVEDVVCSIQRKADTSTYVVRTERGRVLRSHRVLLCTGAFTHCRQLLPAGVTPQLDHRPNTVILVEVDEEELHSLVSMPCVSFRGGPWDRPGLNMVAYILPPVRYPDGKYYLKLGHGNLEPRQLHTPAEITEWYWGGRQPEVESLLCDVTRSLFPGLKMKRYKFDYAVTTNTPQGYPYVDMVQDSSLGVAIGGCGQAAKSSDEIGKMAARMIVRGSWDHDLPQALFKFQAERSGHPSKL